MSEHNQQRKHQNTFFRVFRENMVISPPGLPIRTSVAWDFMCVMFTH